MDSWTAREQLHFGGDTVELYLIRHADAKRVGEDGIESDEERPLTEKGEAQVRQTSAGLQKRGVQIKLLLTSPLVRAKQTAEGLLRQWPAPAPELQACDELAQGQKLKKLTRVLRGLEAESVALVGHEPDLSVFAGWLIGSKNVQIDLAKAGVAYICCDGVRKGAGTLQWLVTPEWLG
jgi:phosphohistidine phosphatase